MSLLYLVLMQVLVFVKVLCMNHVFGLCSDAYAIGKKEKPPFSPQNNPSSPSSSSSDPVPAVSDL